LSASAGEAYVDIVARLDALEQGLSKAKAVSVKSGEEAGKGFGIKWGEKFTEQSKGIIGQLAGPMIAAQLAKAAAGVLRSDKSLPDAILDGLKTIPFVGAFADLGSAIYEATFGAADKAAEELAKKEDAARAKRLEAAAAAAKEEQGQQKNAAGMTYERRSVEIANELNRVRAKGDAEAIARAEYEAKITEQDLATQRAIAEGISDLELNALLKLNQEKRKGFAEERDAKLATIAEEAAKAEEARAKEIQATTDKAQKEQDALYERARAADELAERARIERDYTVAAAKGGEEGARKAADERDRALRAMEKEAALQAAQSDAEREAIEERFALEQETADLKARSVKATEQASRSASSASTALGSFTFDPYPAAEQKRIQQEIADNTKRMAENASSGGFA
jgi:hypothetical protein